MIVSIDVADRAWEKIPGLEELTRRVLDAAAKAAGFDGRNREVNVLFTDDADMAAINLDWRGKHKPTNVLSFPAEEFPVMAGQAQPLGDIVLAAGVVKREAELQGKRLPDHAAHLIIHGFLHLLGHDHEDDDQAKDMEALETAILKDMGIGDPYE